MFRISSRSTHDCINEQNYCMRHTGQIYVLQLNKEPVIQLEKNLTKTSKKRGLGWSLIGGWNQTLPPQDSTGSRNKQIRWRHNYLCKVALVNQEEVAAGDGGWSVMEYPPFAICSLAYLRWARKGSRRPEASFSLAPPTAKITKSHLQIHTEKDTNQKHHNVVHFHLISQSTQPHTHKNKQTNLVLVGVSWNRAYSRGALESIVQRERERERERLRGSWLEIFQAWGGVCRHTHIWRWMEIVCDLDTEREIKKGVAVGREVGWWFELAKCKSLQFKTTAFSLWLAFASLLPFITVEWGRGQTMTPHAPPPLPSSFLISPFFYLLLPRNLLLNTHQFY